MLFQEEHRRISAAWSAAHFFLLLPIARLIAAYAWCRVWVHVQSSLQVVPQYWMPGCASSWSVKRLFQRELWEHALIFALADIDGGRDSPSSTWRLQRTRWAALQGDPCFHRFPEWMFATSSVAALACVLAPLAFGSWCRYHWLSKNWRRNSSAAPKVITHSTAS